MMLLYVCPECGRWQDHSLTVAIGRAMNAFSLALHGKDAQHAETSVLCPDGHGAMRLIEAGEKLFAWSDTAEKPKHDGSLDDLRENNDQHAVVALNTYIAEKPEVYIRGGHGDIECSSIYLDPGQALSLLVWLEQEQATLEQMVRAQEKTGKMP